MSAQDPAREAMLAGLHDIRLPAEAPGGLLAEIAVVLALGIALAVAVAWVLGRLAQPHPQPAAAADLPARIAGLRTLPEEARAMGLLRLLPPGEAAALRARLYQPGGHPDAAALEAALLRAGARDA